MVSFINIFAQEGTGRITGKILDKSNNETIIGATVFIKSLNIGGTSDIEGNFTLVNVPAGTHIVTVSYVGYTDQSLQVILVAGETKNVNFNLLQDQQGVLDQVVVEATRVTDTEDKVLKNRRDSDKIQDAISLQQMQRSASLSAAQALSKVPGVSLKDGRNIAVRGLSGRNLAVQLNGSILPSARPEQADVPVDLIPSQVLDNITVQKSITPDMPGHATGAVVEIKTRSIPEDIFIGAIAQAGFNSNVGLLGEMLSFKNANMGFWGTNVRRFEISDDFIKLREQYANGGLATSQETQQNITRTLQEGAYSAQGNTEAQRINRIMESFDPVLSTNIRNNIAPNQVYSISFGNRYGGNNRKLFGIDFGDRQLGVFIGLNYYRRAQSYRDARNNRFSTREPGSFLATPNILNPTQVRLLRRFSFTEEYAEELLNWGGLGTLSFKFNKFHQISFTYNTNFGFETIADRLIGANNRRIIPGAGAGLANPSSNVVYSLRVTERPFQTYQLHGEHALFSIKDADKVKIKWNVSTSTTSQNDPDFRITDVLIDTLRNISPTSFLTNTRYRVASDRYWRFLDETNQNAKVDISIPVKFGQSASAIFKAGAYYLHRERSYSETVTSRGREASNPSFLPSSAPVPFGKLNENINNWAGPDNLGIIESANTELGSPFVVGYLPNPTNSGNSYEGEQTVFATYAMTDFTINNHFRIAGGLRVEDTDTEGLVDTTQVDLSAANPRFGGINVDTEFEYDSLFVTDQREFQWLPSINFIYSVHENMQFRLAYSKTLARPELNEIIRSAQFDPIQQASIQGNNFVRNASYQNFDFRWDWFLGKQELISASLFYKTIDKQLERVYLPTNSIEIDAFGRVPATISFRNNPSRGELYGVEFEFRQSLGRIATSLNNFFGGINATLQYSETKFPDDELYIRRLLDRFADNKRSLFDMPNYIINANIGFEKEEWGASYNIFFNWTGDRLVEVNIDGTPNIYEQTAPDLDFILSQEILNKKINSTRFVNKKHSLTIRGFVKNILQRPTRFIYKNSIRIGDDKIGTSNETLIRREFTRGTEFTLGLQYTF